MHLSFDGVEGAVVLDGCDELLDPICAVTKGWPSRVVSDGTPPAITISDIANGYSRVSQWTPEPSADDDIADALCDFVSDLIDAYLSGQPKMFALHAAAVDIGGSLVLFPNQRKAGKSLLSVQLAASGAKIFSDDVVPIDPESSHGIALGIAPRLRLPVPASTSDVLQNFLSKYGTIANHRYAYVDLPRNAQPDLGTHLPIKSIVNLHRVDDIPEPELAPLPGSQAVQMMIARNLGFRRTAEEVLEQICGIVTRANCFELHYDDPQTAAEHLIKTLGGNTTE